MCLEPPSFYDNDNISFYTHDKSDNLQPPTISLVPTNVPTILPHHNTTVSIMPASLPDVPVIHIPEFNDTNNLINDLLELEPNLFADVCMELAFETPTSPVAQPILNLEQFNYNDTPMSPPLRHTTSIADKQPIGNNIHLIDVPFSAYPHVDQFHIYPAEYVHPCRICLKTIDFNSLLSISHHIPKGGQIMCAPCLLKFISRQRDCNVDYFYRDLF
jgi:hypothetical protein